MRALPHKTLAVKWARLCGVSNLESYYEKIVQKIGEREKGQIA